MAIDKPKQNICDVIPKHGFGSLSQFIFIDPKRLTIKMREIYNPQDLGMKVSNNKEFGVQIINKIAEHYCSLSPESFTLIQLPGDSWAIQFPSGFQYPDGEEMMIYARMHPERQKDPTLLWSFDRFKRKGDFDIYHLVSISRKSIQRLIDLSKTADKPAFIYKNIGEHCRFNSDKLIWLCDGKEVKSGDQSAELYVPTGYCTPATSENCEKELYLYCKYNQKIHGWSVQHVTHIHKANICHVKPKHGFGSFSQFIFMLRPDSLAKKMKEIYSPEDLEMTVSNDWDFGVQIRNKIAGHYCSLSSDDFIPIQRSGDSPALIFPSGFQYPDGEKMMIHARINRKHQIDPTLQKWFFAGFKRNWDFKNDHTISISSRIFQWIIESSKTSDTWELVLKNISDYCQLHPEKHLWLKDGNSLGVEPGDTDADLCIPTGYHQSSFESSYYNGKPLYIHCKYKEEIQGWQAYRVTVMDESSIEESRHLYDTSPKHGKGFFSRFIQMKPLNLAQKMGETYSPEDLGMIVANEWDFGEQLRNKIAKHYRSLSPEDFTETPIPGGSLSLIFPSGFLYPDGEEMLISAYKNDKSLIDQKSEQWVFDHFRRKDELDISHFISWNKNIVARLISASNTVDRQDVIFKNISAYCRFNPEKLVWLINGYEARPVDIRADLYVPTGYSTPINSATGREELYLHCRYKEEIKGWDVRSVTYRNAPIEIYNFKDWLPFWAGFDLIENPDYPYERLAQKAEPELWEFSKEKRYEILKSYLCYTFYYLYKNYHDGNIGQETIAFGRDWAVFNTGLRDRRTNEYIYAIFKKSTENVTYHPIYFKPQYKLEGYYTTSDGSHILNTEITKLPTPAQYLHDHSEMLLSLSWENANEITVPENLAPHILCDRAERLPLQFYHSAIPYSNHIKEILTAPNTDTREKYEAIQEFLNKAKGHNAEAIQAYQILKKDLDSAVRESLFHGVKQRSFIPVYNPHREEYDFHMPIIFPFSDKVDVVLFVTLSEDENGNTKYEIPTLITPEMSYGSARLVSRHNTEWLTMNT